MKKIILVIAVLLLALFAFILYTFLSTGYFREVNNSNNYQVIAEIPLKGAEDLTISYEDHFMIISQDDRASRRDGNPQQGALYYLDLSQNEFKPKKLETDNKLPFYPHGISLLRLDSAHYQILAINHARGHSIEQFELFGDSLVFRATHRDASMISPNDVVAVDKERFYFTNDHGYTSTLGVLAENYLGLAASNVVYFDGNYQIVADGIQYANGINLSADKKQVLVASPRSFTLKYYERQEDGSLLFDFDQDVGTGIDNIEMDQDGNLWMGAHPNLLRFTAYAAGKKETAPSEIIRINGKQVESVFTDDGEIVSASSVAAVYEDYLFVGTVMDDVLLVLKSK